MPSTIALHNILVRQLPCYHIWKWGGGLVFSRPWASELVNFCTGCVWCYIISPAMVLEVVYALENKPHNIHSMLMYTFFSLFFPLFSFLPHPVFFLNFILNLQLCHEAFSEVGKNCFGTNSHSYVFLSRHNQTQISFQNYSSSWKFFRRGFKEVQSNSTIVILLPQDRFKNIDL